MLEQRQREEVTLKEQFSSKAFQAANLEAYKEQMQEMEAEKQKTEAKLQEALEALAQTQENKGGR